MSNVVDLKTKKRVDYPPITTREARVRQIAKAVKTTINNQGYRMISRQTLDMVVQLLNSEGFVAED